MKKGEKFQVSSSWWEKNKAKTLKSDMGLGALLKKYESSLVALKKEPSEAKYKDTLKLAGEIGTVAKALAGKCTEALHAETKSALLTAPGVVAADTASLSKEASEYQGKLNSARKRYGPLNKKVDDLKAEYDQITVLARNFDKAVKSGFKTIATKRYGEFVDKFKPFAARADQPERILKDEKETIGWCKNLDDKDGREVCSALVNLQQFATVWSRESDHLTHLAMEGKAMLAKMPVD